MPSKFSSKTLWREKLERVQQSKVVDIPPKMRPRFGTGKMLIPRPLDVDELIRKTPKGKVVTSIQLREELARRCEANVSCPITTGIFISIISEAAEEDRRAGKKAITPCWRVITGEGRLNPKFPGGVAAQKRKLVAEGHKIGRAQDKKPPALENFEKRLVHF
ncbi:MAG TPA: MGMT family protein [Verrucomicrobiae bacterium]|nr:MGMT family protein [Verrucomicrobiae bacterium]